MNAETGTWGRPLALGLTFALIAVVGVYEVVILVGVIGPQLGEDFTFYRAIGVRWLAGEPVYLPHQLAGPYELTLQVDNLYPPHALAMFVPFAFLPAVLWWAIPLAVTAYVIWHWRPEWWSWPLIALLIVWPKTLSSVLWGNMDMWLMAGVAAGLRWGWPAIALTIKPSLAPFALIGVRHRGTWALGVTLAVVSAPLLPDYLTAMTNLVAPLDYSLGSIPVMLLPVAAWAGRRSRPGYESLRRFTSARVFLGR